MNWLLLKIIVACIALSIGILDVGTESQQIAALFIIAIAGIPHGATDHVLYNFIMTGSSSAQINTKFLIGYLVVILSYAAMWFVFPALALLLFILISAYHFGEAQLQDMLAPRLLSRSLFFLWGTLVLSLLFYFNALELQTFVSPYLVSEQLFTAFIIWLPGWMLFNFILLFSILLYSDSKRFIKEFFEIIAILILALGSSLVLSFALFFIVWHAREAMIFQIYKLSQVDFTFDFKKWTKRAAPTTIISLLGLAIILISGNFLTIDLPLTTLFFVIVALITLPHAIVMSRFIHLQKKA